MNKMKVEIWSDVMCPFCWIGKHLYEKALSQFPDKDNIETEWMSYQLDPDIPETMDEKVTTSEYLSERKGISLENVSAMMKRITEMGKQNGADFNFEKTVVANTFKAHRILQLAKERGLSEKADSRFFKAFFHEGKDLGDNDVLLEVGKEAGLSEDDVKLALEDEAYAYKVKQDVQEAHNIGLTGVPFFVFNRRYGISGAEPLEIFTKTLNQAYEEWERSNADSSLNISSGQSCSIDGKCE